MKRRFFVLKAFLLAAFSLALFVSTSVCVFATEASKAPITVDIDPAPIVATVALIFGLFILLLLALVFLFRHLGESKRRVKRLSKIQSDDTITLYDELEESKWKDQPDFKDKPRDVVLDDDYSKSASDKKSGVSAPIDTMPKDDLPHGPTPERDVPGYDPEAADKKPELEPVSPYGPIGNGYPAAPGEQLAVAAQSVPPMYQPAQQMPPYSAEAQPMVYTLDSEVEIIMRDLDEPAAPVTVAAPEYPVYASNTRESQIPAEHPTRVKAFRRRGKVPGLVTGTEGGAVVARRARVVPEIPDTDTVEDGNVIPRMNFRHMSIFPRNSGLYSEENGLSTADVVGEDVTVKLTGVPEPKEVAEQEVILEAPIAETDLPASKSAGITADDIIVRLVPKAEAASEGLSRSLDDVLDDLSDAEEVTELETTVAPVREEELVFLGGGEISTEELDGDDIFEKEEGEAKMFVNGKYTTVKYKTSFLSRFIQAEEKTQDYYSVLKNVLMSYGVKSSLDWTCESFYSDDQVCAKINVSDNMVLLYLALDPERYYNYKYHYTYSAYKYDKYKYREHKVPTLVKVNSDRALKYALELVIALMNKLGLAAGEMPDIDYRRPYETIPSLVESGLIKLMYVNGEEISDADISLKKAVGDIASRIDSSESEDSTVEHGAVFDFSDEPMIITLDNELINVVYENEAPASASETVPENEAVSDEATERHEVMFVDAEEADLIVSDEEARASIELVTDSVSHSGKMFEINLDTICENFENGETVNLEALKAKGLVGNSFGRVKVLARGTMTKTLTVYADKFSIQAVKMITLAGGHAEQYK